MIAKVLVTELLEGVYHQYRMHCRRTGKDDGDVRVQVHEGAQNPEPNPPPIKARGNQPVSSGC
eukprot:5173189-Amphidinium_carterae.1